MQLNLKRFKLNAVSKRLRKSFVAIILILGITMPFALTRLNASPVPSVSLNIADNTLVGQNVNFTMLFHNSGTSTGYGPFIDLIIPHNGTDGVYPYNPGLEADGLDFVSAYYNGVPIDVVSNQLFPNTGGQQGCVYHPLATDNFGNQLPVCGTAGDKLVVLQLPFSSYTTAQADAEINVTLSMSNLADINQPLTVYATGGFSLGEDPSYNPNSDPSIYEVYDINQSLPLSWTSDNVTPVLKQVDISKSDNPFRGSNTNFSGYDEDNPTGPNLPYTYNIGVYNPIDQNAGIDGDPVNNFRIIDELPNYIEYVPGSAGVAYPGCSVTQEPTTPGPQNAPNNKLVVTCDYIPGNTNLNVHFDYFIPFFDANGEEIINRTDGDTRSITNHARVEAEWEPTDSRDTIQQITSYESQGNDTSDAKSISIQKFGSIVNNVGDSSLTPGDTVEFTLNFQVSDYFAFKNLVVTDELEDGLRIDPSFTPTLSVTEHGTDYDTQDIDPENYSVFDHFTGGNPEVGFINGDQEIQIQLSQELISSAIGNNGQLLGGCIPNVGTSGDPDCSSYNAGATVGTIKLRAIVQEDYTDRVGDLTVDQGDWLYNSTDITGDVLNTVDLTSSTENQSDESSWDEQITTGSVTKTVYAINGDTGYSNTDLHPGDIVTYRIGYTMLTTDFENLTLVDTLPTDGFNVNDPDADGVENGIDEWTINFDPSNIIPPPGVIQFMTTDSFYPLSQTILPIDGQKPVLSLSGGDNSFTLDYGTFSDPTSSNSKIDLLVSVRVSTQPQTTTHVLTNGVVATINNTDTQDFSSSSTAQVTLLQPEVHITKGVVGSSNNNAVFVESNNSNNVATPYPNSVSFTNGAGTCGKFSGTLSSSALSGTPIVAGIKGIMGNDVVTYAMVLENEGLAPHGAYDITVTDSLPTNVTYNPDSICVFDGTGEEVTYTPVNGGDTNPLFENGITIDDPGATLEPAGAADPYNSSAGRNIIVVMYDVTVEHTAQADTPYINNASLLNYAAVEGGPNYVSSPTTASATIFTAIPEISKTIIDSNLTETVLPGAAIGEVVTYQVTLTLPELTLSYSTLVDNLDNGLAFIGCNSITPSSVDITTDGSNDFSSVCSGASVDNNGATVTYNFGELLDSDTVHATPETITISYDTVVLNIGDNAITHTLYNNAGYSWGQTEFTPVNTIHAIADPLTIQEPQLYVSKSFSPDTGDAGDTTTVTITINADDAYYRTTAFDTAIEDILSSQFQYSGSLVCSDNSGTQSTCEENSGTISATWEAIAPGISETISFDVVISNTVTPGELEYNSADIHYSSLPSDPGQQSVYNTDSYERTYMDTGSASFQIAHAVGTKSIVSTSESDTGFVDGAERVAIGEVVRYRLVADLPESGMLGMTLTDYIPEGMSFINDNTAKIAFVSNGGLSSPDLDPIVIDCTGSESALLNFTGDETSVDSVTPECIMPDSTVSSDSTGEDNYYSGRMVNFRLGDLVNADSDSNHEFVVIEFNALVRNESANISGYNLQNYFEIQPDGDFGATSNTVNTYVAEPGISVLKQVAQAPEKGGDQAIYQIVVHNSNNTNDSTAYDLYLTDNLPSSLSLVSADVISKPGYVSVTDNTSGDDIGLAFNQLNKGDSIVILVTADTTAEVSAGQEIANSATVTYSSLPDTNGSLMNSTGSSNTGISGDADGERNSQDGIDEGALNNYQRSDTATSEIGLPYIEENNASPTSAPIGGTTTFTSIVTLIQGTTQHLVINDQIPDGMTYQSYSLVTDVDAGEGHLSSNFGGTLDTPTVNGGSADGEDVSFDFGDVVIPSGGIKFLIKVDAMFDNVSANQSNVSLNNTVSLDFTNPNTALTQTINAPIGINVDVLEPILDISKTATEFPSSAMAGSTITYQIHLAHNAESNSDAHEVIIMDPATSQLTNITNVQIDATGISDPSYEIFGNALKIPNTEDDSFDFPLGATLTITYDVQIDASVGPAETITNSANVIWSSVSGMNSQKRTSGDGNYDLSESNANGLNDYQFSAQDNSVATDSPNIEKLLLSTSASNTSDSTNPVQTTIGEFLTFFLRVEVPEGTTSSLNLIDELPVNLEYVSSGVATLASESEGGLTTDFNGTLDLNATNTSAGDGNDVEFDFANIVNNPDGLGQNDFYGVLLTARVVDSDDNIGLSGSQSTFSNTLIGNADALDLGSNSINFIVVEPDLSITKDFDVGSATPNQVVTVTSTITNNGTSTAYETLWSDDIDEISPGTMTYVTGSFNQICSSVLSGDPLLDPTHLVATIGVLPAGEYCTETYSVRLAGNLTDNDTVTNQAKITRTSNLLGNLENERNYSEQTASDSLDVDIPDLSLEKTSDVSGTVGLGDIITYTLSVDNIGSYPADGVVLYETVPYDTNFNNSASTSGWECTPNNLAGSECTFDVSSYLDHQLSPADDPLNINFAVNVNNSVPAGTTQIVNTAGVHDNGEHGTDPTVFNNISTHSDFLSNDFFPDIYVDTTDNGNSVHTNEVLIYDISYGNIGSIGTTNTVITETVPTGTEFVSDQSTVGWNCSPSILAGSTCTLDVGTLNPGVTGTAIFAVQVTMYLPDISDVENTITIDNDGANGVDSNLVNNIDSETTPVLYTNVFDPPSAQKTFNDDGSANIEWKMVWINDGNSIATQVLIIDPIPTGTVYVPNSFICDARGSSITARCEYNAIDNQVEWEGSIGPDLGGTTEENSLNEVVLTLKTTVPTSMDTVSNQAHAFWDGNDDGDITDDIDLGQTPVVTNDPNTSNSQDTTVWQRAELVNTGIDITNRIYFVLLISALLFILSKTNFEKISKFEFKIKNRKDNKKSLSKLHTEDFSN